MPDAGYFSGHAFAAGNPVDPSVRSLLPEELDALPPSGRPRRVALLPAPDGSPDWLGRYGSRLERSGYNIVTLGRHGAIFER
jgi:hypothetical protein